ncbi:MAG: hypothetical protein U9P36_11770, partial [Thermodesulfobacteriota bacterium]|nr:hypothetical protein [Thermodesulfobacteriota bacterium]
MATQEKETAAHAETLNMLTSLVKLQEGIKQQIEISKTKLETTTSDAEKMSLQDELTRLDRQLAGTSNDFERIATGVEVSTEIDEAINYLHQLYLEIQQEIRALQGHEHDDQKDLYDGLET